MPITLETNRSYTLKNVSRIRLSEVNANYKSANVVANSTTTKTILVREVQRLFVYHKNITIILFAFDV